MRRAFSFCCACLLLSAAVGCKKKNQARTDEVVEATDRPAPGASGSETPALDLGGPPSGVAPPTPVVPPPPTAGGEPERGRWDPDPRGGPIPLWGDRPPKPPEPYDPANGKDIYVRYCGSCHGADGTGAAIRGYMAEIGDLSSAERQKALTDAQLEEVIRKGRNKMPAFDTMLTPEQSKALITYVRSFKKG